MSTSLIGLISKIMKITEHFPCFHLLSPKDHDTNAATARQPTYPSATSQRLFSEITCVDLQIWGIKISSVLRTSVAMHNTDINNENIGNSAINIVMAFRSDFKIQYQKSSLVIHLCC